MLERLGEPVGVVTAIQGQSHAEVTFAGEAGHAGTTPMEDRRDALTAAAEWILAVERAGGTVGRVQVEPNVRNVIPGSVTVTLDLRHPDDATRRATFEALRAEAGQGRDVEVDVARRRATAPPWRWTSGSPPRSASTHTAPQRRRPRRRDDGPHRPAAMLFVRSRGGSHNPAESVEEADVAVALDALERLLRAV